MLGLSFLDRWIRKSQAPTAAKPAEAELEKQIPGEITPLNPTPPKNLGDTGLPTPPPPPPQELAEAPGGAGKEPRETPRKQYLEERIRILGQQPAPVTPETYYPGMEPKESAKMFLAKMEDYHRKFVEKALVDHQTVPEDVIVDYPDLEQKYKNAPGSQQPPPATNPVTAPMPMENLPQSPWEPISNTPGANPEPSMDVEKLERNAEAQIVPEGGQWRVVSNTGKHFGTYPSREEAVQRLRQMDHFNLMKKDQPPASKKAQKLPDDWEYTPGDGLDIEVGDKVRCTYGEFWVTGTNTVGGLWTSEYAEDLDTGKGRGLRPTYVEAVQKQGTGPWYPVEVERGEDVATVLPPQEDSSKKEAALEVTATIKEESDGWHVYSEEGKNLGGPYKTKGEAVTRLRQVEYFKHHKSQKIHKYPWSDLKNGDVVEIVGTSPKKTDWYGARLTVTQNTGGPGIIADLIKAPKGVSIPATHSYVDKNWEFKLIPTKATPGAATIASPDTAKCSVCGSLTKPTQWQQLAGFQHAVPVCDDCWNDIQQMRSKKKGTPKSSPASAPGTPGKVQQFKPGDVVKHVPSKKEGIVKLVVDKNTPFAALQSMKISKSFLQAAIAQLMSGKTYYHVDVLGTTTIDEDLWDSKDVVAGTPKTAPGGSAPASGAPNKGTIYKYPWEKGGLKVGDLITVIAPPNSHILNMNIQINTFGYLSGSIHGKMVGGPLNGQSVKISGTHNKDYEFVYATVPGVGAAPAAGGTTISHPWKGIKAGDTLTVGGKGSKSSSNYKGRSIKVKTVHPDGSVTGTFEDGPDKGQDYRFKNPDWEFQTPKTASLKTFYLRVSQKIKENTVTTHYSPETAEKVGGVIAGLKEEGFLVGRSDTDECVWLKFSPNICPANRVCILFWLNEKGEVNNIEVMSKVAGDTTGILEDEEKIKTLSGEATVDSIISAVDSAAKSAKASEEEAHPKPPVLDKKMMEFTPKIRQKPVEDIEEKVEETAGGMQLSAWHQVAAVPKVCPKCRKNMKRGFTIHTKGDKVLSVCKDCYDKYNSEGSGKATKAWHTTASTSDMRHCENCGKASDDIKATKGQYLCPKCRRSTTAQYNTIPSDEDSLNGYDVMKECDNCGNFSLDVTEQEDGRCLCQRCISKANPVINKAVNEEDHLESEENHEEDHMEVEAARIKNKGGKWVAVSDSGKEFGSYSTKEEAYERVKQMEGWKAHGEGKPRKRSAAYYDKFWQKIAEKLSPDAAKSYEEGVEFIPVDDVVYAMSKDGYYVVRMETAGKDVVGKDGFLNEEHKLKVSAKLGSKV